MSSISTFTWLISEPGHACVSNLHTQDAHHGERLEFVQLGFLVGRGSSEKLPGFSRFTSSYLQHLESVKGNTSGLPGRNFNIHIPHNLIRTWGRQISQNWWKICDTITVWAQCKYLSESSRKIHYAVLSWQGLWAKISCFCVLPDIRIIFNTIIMSISVFGEQVGRRKQTWSPLSEPPLWYTMYHCSLHTVWRLCVEERYFQQFPLSSVGHIAAEGQKDVRVK